MGFNRQTVNPGPLPFPLQHLKLNILRRHHIISFSKLDSISWRVAICTPPNPDHRPLPPPDPAVPVQHPHRHSRHLGGYLHWHHRGRCRVKWPRSERHGKLGPLIPHLVTHCGCALTDLLCVRSPDHWHLQLGECILDSTVFICYDWGSRAI